MKKKKGKYEYCILDNHPDPNEADFVGWDCFFADTDEEAIQHYEARTKITSGMMIAKIIAITHTSIKKVEE